MRTTITSPGRAILIFCGAVISSASVAAEQFDGSNDLICAAIDVVACTELNNPYCSQGQASSYDLPEFMTIDFKKKEIHAVEESGIEEVSPIRNIAKTDDSLILQGDENERAWSAVINRETGHMALSVSGNEISFIVFGACTAR
jgi:hypothetical protein